MSNIIYLNQLKKPDYFNEEVTLFLYGDREFLSLEDAHKYATKAFEDQNSYSSVAYNVMFVSIVEKKGGQVVNTHEFEFEYISGVESYARYYLWSK